MRAGAAALFGALLLTVVSAEQKCITAKPGQNVTLPCRAPNSNNMVVEWSRADLGSEYVCVYRDGQFDPDNQHPSFKNRVDLQDRQMKDGDVSVILKNVTINDTGTYECRVFMRGTRSWKNISIIYLRVSPPGSGGAVGLIVGLLVPAVLLLAAVAGFWFYRKSKGQQKDSYEPPAELQPV